MAKLKTVPDIIAAFGGGVQFAKAAGITKFRKQMGYNMKSRGLIPLKYWPALIESAHERGIKINADVLLRVHTS